MTKLARVRWTNSYMAIIISNSPWMFTVFSRGDHYQMTVVAGGVAMYNLTVRLSREEVEQFKSDENKAIAMARDVLTRTPAYKPRVVWPSVDPT